MNKRYDGKPFLRLLECYVLASIGQLHEDQNSSLIAMEGKLSEIYGVKAGWYDIVAIQMDFSKNLPEKIKELWKRNLEILHSKNLPVNPEDFAKSFVDQNFPDV